MDIINIENRKLIAKSGDHAVRVRLNKDWNVPVDGTRKVISYGILRNYPEAGSEVFDLKGLAMVSLEGGYPQCYFDEDSVVKVQLLTDIDPPTKNHMDVMELGAGYDIYEVEHEGEAYHLYVASDRLTKIIARRRGDKRFKSIEIPHGDFIRYLEEDRDLLNAFKQNQGWKNEE